MKEMKVVDYIKYIKETNNKENYISSYFLDYFFYKNRISYNIKKGNLNPVFITVAKKRKNKYTKEKTRYYIFYTVDLLKFIKQKQIKINDAIDLYKIFELSKWRLENGGLLKEILEIAMNGGSNILDYLDLDLLDNKLFTETSFYKKYYKDKKLNKKLLQYKNIVTI